MSQRSTSCHGWSPLFGLFFAAFQSHERSSQASVLAGSCQHRAKLVICVELQCVFFVGGWGGRKLLNSTRFLHHHSGVKMCRISTREQHRGAICNSPAIDQVCLAVGKSPTYFLAAVTSALSESKGTLSSHTHTCAHVCTKHTHSSAVH